MITSLVKIEIKLHTTIFLIFVFSTLNFVGAQDVMRLQYKDSICANVVDVSKKEVTYQTQTFYDSAQYSIDRKNVVEIKYANGTVAQVSKSRWDKFYRPSIFLSVGPNEYESGGEHFNLSTLSMGLGNKGLFRLPVKGFGIVYNVEIDFGQYDLHDYSGSVNTDYSSGFFYSLNFSAGLEYRYSIYRGLGFYGDFQIGKRYVDYNQPNIKFYSENLIYSFSTGIYMHRFQLGLKYNWGRLMRQSDPVPGEIWQLITQYDLSEIRFFVAFTF